MLTHHRIDSNYTILRCSKLNKVASYNVLNIKDRFWNTCEIWKELRICTKCQHSIFCQSKDLGDFGMAEECTNCELKFRCCTISEDE